MSLESKEIYVGTVAKKEEEIKLRKNFGWKYVEDRNHGRSGGLHIVLVRVEGMKNYSELVSLENEYDDCKKKLKTYNKIVEEPEDLLFIFALFIMLIFPLVIYCAFKSNQKQKIAENNAKLHKRMDEIVLEAQALL